jgi:protein translocase SecG subunit
MSLVITLLTIFLVIDSVILGFLILIQLPKKEAGLGQAFGSQVTDMLLGAGTGTVLTKATKYCAAIFLGLSLILSILTSRANPHKARLTEFERALPKAGQTTAVQKPAETTAKPAEDSILKTPLVTQTNLLITATNKPASAPATQTNAPAASTNK